jgi:MoxR-like ATPase
MALLSLVPGVLSQAYKNGGVLPLDELDLCPPEVLTYTLAALDDSMIEIDGNQIRRHPNFRNLTTLNGGRLPILPPRKETSCQPRSWFPFAQFHFPRWAELNVMPFLGL